MMLRTSGICSLILASSSDKLVLRSRSMRRRSVDSSTQGPNKATMVSRHSLKWVILLEKENTSRNASMVPSRLSTFTMASASCFLTSASDVLVSPKPTVSQIEYRSQLACSTLKVQDSVSSETRKYSFPRIEFPAELLPWPVIPHSTRVFFLASIWYVSIIQVVNALMKEQIEIEYESQSEGHCRGFYPILILPTSLNCGVLNFFLRASIWSFSSTFCSSEQMSLAHWRMSFSLRWVVCCKSASQQGVLRRIFLMKKMLAAAMCLDEYLAIRKSSRHISTRQRAKKQSFSSRLAFLVNTYRQASECVCSSSKSRARRMLPYISRMSARVYVESHINIRLLTFGTWQISSNLAAIHRLVMPSSCSRPRWMVRRSKYRSIRPTAMNRVCGSSLYFRWTSTSQFRRMPRMCAEMSVWTWKQLLRAGLLCSSLTRNSAISCSQMSVGSVGWAATSISIQVPRSDCSDAVSTGVGSRSCLAGTFSRWEWGCCGCVRRLPATDTSRPLLPISNPKALPKHCCPCSEEQFILTIRIITEHAFQSQNIATTFQANSQYPWIPRQPFGWLSQPY